MTVLPLYHTTVGLGYPATLQGKVRSLPIRTDVGLAVGRR